ncbi:MAG TPA: carboxylate-amine ligase [Chitinophagales bacterium]|nr:carboxylate-amine ligase [Chitinophagales bacterium]HMU70294.1 carboxylate-amine ligase [Chitinophagales bacterium]HMX04565.1 carboxylate-amine ligase [Chitinophagales bacterium]HMZ89074.1 carboxylate-amine ligase [Chitinophagales bacterium]HNE46827.1 carboxylate-amine ligase [Chitinophagales bacterium]
MSIYKDFTLGIEEEFQIIDPETRDLSHRKHHIIDAAAKYNVDIKAEMHQSVVEAATTICKDIHDARNQVVKLRRIIADLADKDNLKIAAAGTHPFAAWEEQLITNHPRYQEIVNEFQEAARSNLIFGLHVHIGMPSRDVAVFMMNSLRYFIPHIFALSTNSPFWEGRDTGFKSFRTKVFDKFPRTGIPDVFNDASHFDNFIALLVKTNCIDNGKKIWWDLRVHPYFNTIEFRMCDIPMRADETIALAALMQALTVKLYKLMKSNIGWRNYDRALIQENKWRAARYGISGKLIDFGKQEESETRGLVLELLDFVDDVVDELGSREALENVRWILDNGTGADRQVKMYYEKNRDFKALADYMIDETYIGI